MKDIKLNSPVRAKAFTKFIGEKVLVWHIPSGSVYPGVLIGKTKFKIRIKTTSGEMRLEKADIFLVDYDCYNELLDLVNTYQEKKSELEILINNNVIL
tara:strand:+ start:347 stop:640 length:294 start_codon:yes stop_codon:yes gene_type:complete